MTTKPCLVAEGEVPSRVDFPQLRLCLLKLATVSRLLLIGVLLQVYGDVLGLSQLYASIILE